MDLRTAASTEFAGAKQPEMPLPPGAHRRSTSIRRA